MFFFSSAFASDIAVITIAAGAEYRQAVSLGLENKKKYCELHGYDFIVREEALDPSRPPSWSKILLMDELMATTSYKWIFWTDADSLIMNSAIRLEDLIDERYNMVITVDFNSICAGEFFMKNCDWSRQFLKIIYGHTECITHRWWEQCGMIQELGVNPSHYAFIKLLPQRLMNSFPREIFPNCGLKEIYQPGDFIFHFAGTDFHFPGRGLEVLSGLMQKYSQETVNDLSLFTLDYYLGIYGIENSKEYMTSSQKKQFEERLKASPSIQNILVIGLSGGQSADQFFSYCDNLKKLVSFDLNVLPSVKPAAEYFFRKYKDRFFFVEGDSSNEIPKFQQSNPNANFDLVYIDGSQSEQNTLLDILNTHSLSHGNTRLWINNYHSPEVKQAVMECVNRGKIQILDIHESSDPSGQLSWVEARYSEKPRGKRK